MSYRSSRATSKSFPRHDFNRDRSGSPPRDPRGSRARGYNSGNHAVHDHLYTPGAAGGMDGPTVLLSASEYERLAGRSVHATGRSQPTTGAPILTQNALFRTGEAILAEQQLANMGVLSNDPAAVQARQSKLVRVTAQAMAATPFATHVVQQAAQEVFDHSISSAEVNKKFEEAAVKAMSQDVVKAQV